MRASSTVVVLSGGVGGARFADGVAQAVEPEDLVVAVNVGDDFTHLGLEICPDLDTVVYTLAGIADGMHGWGRADESWQCMAALAALGGPDWFRIGDKDLAVHLLRTEKLRAGEALSAVMSNLARDMGVSCTVLPVTDDRVPTVVETECGELSFQDYFVRLRCAPSVRAIHHVGAEVASLATPLANRLAQTPPRAVLLGPSNPYLSIAPMLAIPGLRAWLGECEAPIVAISPIVAGNAVKGPAAKIMRELGVIPGPAAVIDCYAEFLDGMIVDVRDGLLVDAIGDCPVRAIDTLMHTREDRMRVANEALAFAEGLA